jgi:protein angel
MTALSYMEDEELGGVTQSLDGPVKEKKRPRRFARPWISEGGHAQDERDLRVTDDSKQSLVFRVCSYNVLAQSLVEKNPKLYVHCSPEYMLWTYRRSLLLEELLDLDSDVICLQEVDKDAFNSWFEPQLKSRGYWGVYKKRTGQQSDGCAVFVRGSVFHIDYSLSVEYQEKCSVLNRDNVGIILIVRSVSQPRNLCCIATTHILYNPKAGEVKLAQIALLLAKIHRLISHPDRDYRSCPLVLCGDFNMKPLCHLHRFLLDGRLDYTNVSAHQASGYGHKTNRRIPFPLFPENLGIGNNCMYAKASVSPKVKDGERPPVKKICSSLESDHTSVLSTAASKWEPDHVSLGSTFSIAQLQPTDYQLPPEVSSNCELQPSTLGARSSTKNPGCSQPNTSTDFKGKPSQPSASLDQVHSSVHQPILCSSQPHVITHPFKLSNVYPHYHIYGNQPSSVTTFHSSTLDHTDYIFFTPVSSGRGSRLLLTQRLALPSIRTFLDAGPMPNRCQSSDHILLCATFALQDSDNI